MRVCLALAVLAVAAHAAAAERRPRLVPWPAEIAFGTGEMAIGPDFRLTIAGQADPRVQRAARRFEARLARQAGLLPPLGPGQTRLEVRCNGPARTALPALGMDESYALEITPAKATLTAAEPWGILRGLETFLQLVGPGSEGLRVPAVVIRDRPRFPWRGLLIDCGRHFMPLQVLERNLDGMAAVKLNVLHWHLTEDQGFRVESRRFPKLHLQGSDGLYYTQEQIKGVIAYAADRGIRVVPEFDMPGHTTAWFVGHPELASAPGPYTIERKWGIFEPVMDPTREEVYRLLDGFLGEMAALFPDPFLHIGGDEVEGKPWEASAQIQAFKKEKGFKDNHDLQAYFNQRLSRILTRHGKQMMGWDEALHPDLPRDTVVQSWRGQDSLAKAARQGFRGILSFGYYLDLMQPAASYYATEPLDKDAANLDEAQRARILGGEACMWAEYVSPETVDSRIWPRAGAVAERLWSPREVRDADDMYGRLEGLSRWLEWLGLEHRSGYPRMLGRLAGPDAGAVKALTDLVEPVKGYERGQTAPYTQQTPLTGLVDAARPESDAAREFARAVDRLLADPPRQAGREALRARLAEWQALYPRLLPVLQRSSLLRDALPQAAELQALAGAGLEALAFLEQGTPAPAAWWEDRARLLERPRKPASALDAAIRPAVKKLLEAARSAPTAFP
jgi:hexosaminidase